VKEEDPDDYGYESSAYWERVQASGHVCNHVDFSGNRALLLGNALDRARWLLCSEGWSHDAAMLDEYVAGLRAEIARLHSPA